MDHHQYVRLIKRNWIHFDFTSPEERRLSSCAFRNSSDGTGISCISVSCINETTGDICEHIRRFHPAFVPVVVGAPIIFWPFSMDDLPEKAIFNQEKSNDDECHVNVKNLSNNDAEKIIKKLPLNKLMVCINSSVHPFDFDEHYLKFRDRVN